MFYDKIVEISTNSVYFLSRYITMSEPITISFLGNTELKALLKQWAKEDDRSVSYVMRQMLNREAQRRAQTQPEGQKRATTQQSH
jgi:hypothetical protein